MQKIISLKRITDDSTEVTIDYFAEEKSMVFPSSFKLLIMGIYRYEIGNLMQDAFSFLGKDYREFLISGLTPEEFDELVEEDE